MALVQVVKCLNVNCSNEITGFGLKRLSRISLYKDGTMRFSKWRICQSCRHGKIITIRCKNCNIPYESKTEMVRMYCDSSCRKQNGIDKQSESKRIG